MKLKIITLNLNELIRDNFKMNGLNGFSNGFESIPVKFMVFQWNFIDFYDVRASQFEGQWASLSIT